ncbi:MAG: alpha/beta hydrolase [Actinomycetota bacterium]|nr:alpha/beta hydrolase [Actinomycetota bacterium]
MRSYEISWPVGPTAVYGTVVEPDGRGPFPAVVFVAGSGPTDRDWNSPLLPGSNGSGRLLAEALADSGFASLRYDKRAAGPHAQENMPLLIGAMSMQSHLDELTGAVEALTHHAPVRHDGLFGLGNSEGTLHVLNYAAGQTAWPLAGVVLTAPPGRSVGEVARSQVAAQVLAAPADGAGILADYDAAISRFLAGQPVAPSPGLPEAIRQMLSALESPVNLPFARQLWTADAATLLQQVDTAALIVIGKKDVQVDWKTEGEVLQRATAGRDDVAFSFPENANHVLKHEDRPASELLQADVVTGYNAAGTYLDPEAVTAIVDWLQARAAGPGPDPRS